MSCSKHDEVYKFADPKAAKEAIDKTFNELYSRIEESKIEDRLMAKVDVPVTIKIAMPKKVANAVRAVLGMKMLRPIAIPKVAKDS